MAPSPLNNGGSSRRTGLTRTPTPIPGSALPPGSKAAMKSRAQPEAPAPTYQPFRPEYARSQAGKETPQSISYENLPSLANSVDNLVPGKRGSSSKTPAILGEALEMKDLSKKSRRKERPLDPSIAAITIKDTPRTRQLEQYTTVPLTQPHSEPGSRRNSTDDWGHPRAEGAAAQPAQPAKTHKEIKEEIQGEEKKILSKTRKVGAAITAAIGTVILGGAAAMTYKEANGRM